MFCLPFHPVVSFSNVFCLLSSPLSVCYLVLVRSRYPTNLWVKAFHLVGWGCWCSLFCCCTEFFLGVLCSKKTTFLHWRNLEGCCSNWELGFLQNKNQQMTADTVCAYTLQKVLLLRYWKYMKKLPDCFHWESRMESAFIPHYLL